VSPRFADRRDAGRALAGALHHYAHRNGVVVLALPRGGVPVAVEVARVLGAPLDVFVVRKLGAPGRPELAMGAIASGGIRVLNARVVDWYRPSPEELQRVTEVEQRELERRELAYRGHRDRVPIAGRIVILVDDGLATGASMRAAVQAVRALAPSQVVVAVPVGAPDSCRSIAMDADEVVCVERPASFEAVGSWYRDFSQTTDEEVRELLAAQAAGTQTAEFIRRHEG
jgi:putative phosphoribosyl transferase